jgi:hypothetical protein
MDSVKTQRVLLSSGARTATTASGQQTDYLLLAVRLYLNVTAASGAGGLQPILRGYDKVSGNAVALSTGGTAITATGLYVYEFGLNVAAAAGNVKEAVSRFLPVQWDVDVVHGDGSSYTYSLSADVVGA